MMDSQTPERIFFNNGREIDTECITDEGGMLDKFIGDAMQLKLPTARDKSTTFLALQVAHDDDPDRAVRAAR